MTKRKGTSAMTDDEKGNSSTTIPESATASVPDVYATKREQISKTNRSMFMCVAGVSVIFGFALVGAIFILQMIMFNEKVIQEKNKTISTLESNIVNVKKLRTQIKLLDTKEEFFKTLKLEDKDHAVQVILDALPTDNNMLALGASLQQKLLGSVDDLKLESLSVDDRDYGSLSSVAVQDLSASIDIYATKFNVTVSGNDKALIKLLNNFEKSIRTIDIATLNITANNGDNRTMSIIGKAFYEPKRTIELKEKKVTK